MPKQKLTTRTAAADGPLRYRQQVSCDECRRRKSKCTREDEQSGCCQNCSRRGQPCVFSITHAGRNCAERTDKRRAIRTENRSRYVVCTAGSPRKNDFDPTVAPPNLNDGRQRLLQWVEGLNDSWDGVGNEGCEYHNAKPGGVTSHESVAGETKLPTPSLRELASFSTHSKGMKPQFPGTIVAQGAGDMRRQLSDQEQELFASAERPKHTTSLSQDLHLYMESIKQRLDRLEASPSSEPLKTVDVDVDVGVGLYNASSRSKCLQASIEDRCNHNAQTLLQEMERYQVSSTGSTALISVSGLTTAREIASTDSVVQCMEEMLECSCIMDARVVSTLVAVVGKVVDWFQAVAMSARANIEKDRTSLEFDSLGHTESIQQIREEHVALGRRNLMASRSREERIEPWDPLHVTNPSTWPSSSHQVLGRPESIIRLVIPRIAKVRKLIRAFEADEKEGFA